MQRMRLAAFLLCAIATAFFTIPCERLLMAETAVESNSKPLVLHIRSVKAKSPSDPADKDTVKETTVTWDPRKTALIVCDMWDNHWCKGAARRVEELAEPMNKVVQEARHRGVFIIHAPSTTVDFYKDTPQRKRAMDAKFAKTLSPLSTVERWGTAWCYPDSKRECELPIDDTDMGCDCATKCEIVPPWTRQIKTIDIAEPDAITDNGQETFNLLAERKIDNVIIMGVHLNMCVLGRPFAIRQLVSQGKNVLLIRDMTDTMYCSKSKPYVNHFAGTDLVISHVEKNWCPTILSTDFVGGKPFQFQEDKRLPIATK
jgi:nicotinamidase-related amidase